MTFSFIINLDVEKSAVNFIEFGGYVIGETNCTA